jgi:hypothetical protein
MKEIKSIWSEIWGDLKAIFSKNTNSKLLKDLEVQKGFKAGLKYWTIILVVLPIKILRIIANIDYPFVFFMQKLFMAFISIFEIEKLKSLGENYAIFVNAILQKGENIVKPNLANVQEIINIYRLVKILSVAFVFVFASEMVDLGVEAIVGMLNHLFAMVTATTTTTAFTVLAPNSASDGFLVGLSVWAVLQLIFYFAVSIFVFTFFAYLFFAFLKLLYKEFKAFLYVDMDDLAQFLIEELDYTYAKTAELYGEDVAKKALMMMLENYVVKNNEFDVVVNDEKLLEIRDEYKKLIKKENENKNNERGEQ